MGSFVASRGELTHVFTMFSLLLDDAAVGSIVALVVDDETVVDEVLESSDVSVVSLDEVVDEHEASTDTNTSTVNDRRRDVLVFVIDSLDRRAICSNWLLLGLL